ncbi:ABC transporter ATP-binding protein [Anaeromicrobium sediminis]|uniref:Dipeptide/oligopeptide/nickel ABC transporter ATP-binding protein n=1 Tax=Anaeromicrobium sediminis TaxID=1478221 RepID=A0A267MG57_9FIRM|nr:ABC transporter ATP-binding protein [Anaeromicrobium sediminis]PAB58564.1 dipeptide/oligopeptide/nickel ABC transporter ATP-binding protein [Anaeromicrobium sediminis]
MSGEKLLDIRDLSIQYKTDEGIVHAVEGLNLHLGKGQNLGFVGETGAGKTTTALGIMRLVPNPPGEIVEGEIFFQNENLLEKSQDEMRNIRGEQIAMIFQDPMTSLNPVMTVGDQIAEMIELHKNVNRKEAFKSAEEMLEKVGIRKERAHDYPHQFSGGMKQRVVIAIALACNPSLIIADEPTTALDVTIQAQVLELMKELKEEYKTSMILITHDLGVVAEICDQVAIMYAGRVVEYTNVKNLYENPLHPYTLGLFNSIPDLDAEQEELHVISGVLPDPTNLPRGCAFHPRCEKAMDICSCEKPKMREISNGHFAACFLFEGKE